MVKLHICFRVINQLGSLAARIRSTDQQNRSQYIQHCKLKDTS